MSSSPRLLKYPHWSVPAWSFTKAYLYQSTLGCTLLTVASFTLYSNLVNYLRARLQWSDQGLFVLLLSGSHTLVYGLVNGLFSSTAFDKYRFSRSKGQTPTSDLIKSTLVAAFVSQVITSPILTYFLYPGFEALGLKSLTAPLPSFKDLAWTFLGAHAFNDLGFYWSHRLLHEVPFLYRTVHKQHHEYAGSIGIAAEYAHPIESLFSNIIPSIGGVIFFGCHHPLCIIVWVSVRLYQTYCAHGGLAQQGTVVDALGFGHVESACFHDHHHTANKGNFGSCVTDWLFGTMDSYVEGGMHEGYLIKMGVKKKG